MTVASTRHSQYPLRYAVIRLFETLFEGQDPDALDFVLGELENYHSLPAHRFLIEMGVFEELAPVLAMLDNRWTTRFRTLPTEYQNALLRYAQDWWIDPRSHGTQRLAHATAESFANAFLPVGEKPWTLRLPRLEAIRTQMLRDYDDNAKFEVEFGSLLDQLEMDLGLVFNL